MATLKNIVRLTEEIRDVFKRPTSPAELKAVRSGKAAIELPDGKKVKIAFKFEQENEAGIIVGDIVMFNSTNPTKPFFGVGKISDIIHSEKIDDRTEKTSWKSFGQLFIEKDKGCTAEFKNKTIDIKIDVFLDNTSAGTPMKNKKHLILTNLKDMFTTERNEETDLFLLR